uniref:Uncharacterized protein n=1 Tax=Anguilla anguilla TaxID=7936 RepID=A0A0E9TI95_ANGAN
MLVTPSCYLCLTVFCYTVLDTLLSCTTLCFPARKSMN